MVPGGVARTRRALAGARVEPPARGITFVAPELLPGSPGASFGPAQRLASFCRGLGLDFAFIVWDRPWAHEAITALAEAGVAAHAVVDGVVWPALAALGFEEGLRASVRDPGALTAAMDAELRRALREAADALGRPGVAGLVVADDMAGAAGPLLDTSFLASEAFPRLSRLARAAAASDVPAVLHCDGDVRALLGPAARAGFAAIHGDFGGPGRLDAALADARGEGIALVGGLATAALADSTSAAAAGSVAATRARSGGLLVADDGGVSSREEATALLAALAATRC